MEIETEYPNWALKDLEAESMAITIAANRFFICRDQSDRDCFVHDCAVCTDQTLESDEGSTDLVSAKTAIAQIIMDGIGSDLAVGGKVARHELPPTE